MTLDWSRACVLSAEAFEACWAGWGLGETPWQLDPPRHGRTAPARREFIAQVRAQAARAGGDLRGWLRLLARPQWSVDVRLRANDGASCGTLVAGLAACRGPDGVLAVRHGGELALVPVAAHTATAALLQLLGPVRPGPGRPLLFSVADGSPSPQVVAACGDVRMFGQLGASVAARGSGPVRRMPHVVGFHRTTAGDYRSVRVNRGSVAIEPATHARLLADLDELLLVPAG